MADRDTVEARKLLDKLTSNDGTGRLMGALATSYEFDPSFVEKDWLPTAYGLGTWDDRGWASRIALEKALDRSHGVSLLVDGRRVREAGTAPRSYRVELQPAVGPRGELLHAKVSLLLYEHTLRLVVTSANLTEAGYRKNREVAAVLEVSPKRPQLAGLVRTALEQMSTILEPWWTKTDEKLVHEACDWLDSLKQVAAPPDLSFAWSGPHMPLHEQVLKQWDPRDHVRRLSIVSPFWSEEDGHGPLARFVAALRAHSSEPFDVDLYTDGDPYAANRPRLPASLGTFDAARIGVRARAIAADPGVLDEEVLRKDFAGDRRLHAKALLIEGKQTWVAYWGSANFSGRGWGYEAVPNIEAGLIARGRGSPRDIRTALIPPTAGTWLALDGRGADAFTITTLTEEEPVWPTFIRSILLAPNPADRSNLGLLVVIDASQVHGSWSIGRGTTGESWKALVETPAETTVYIPLEPTMLTTLLKEREVVVRWWALPAGRGYPINVAPEARDALPLAPEASSPDEKSLLSYFQGKISWEDLFPVPLDDEDEQTPRQSVPEEPLASIDTSKIQSYIVRDFVEALAGIRSELRGAIDCEPSMRQAVRGPVSPLALARQIAGAVKEGARTPTAGAFQLIELLACLFDARGWDEVPSKLVVAWQGLLDAAILDIEDLLRAVKQQAVREESFERYERSLRAEWERGQ